MGEIALAFCALAFCALAFCALAFYALAFYALGAACLLPSTRRSALDTNPSSG